MSTTNSSTPIPHHDAVSGPHFAIPTAAAPEPPPLKSLQTSIEEILVTSERQDEVIQRILDLALQITNATEVAYCSRQTGRVRLRQTGGKRIFPDTESQGLLEQWHTEVSDSRSVQLDQVDGHSETIASLPVFLPNGDLETLHAALLIRGGRIEPLVVSLQLLATGLSSWYARLAARQTEFEAHVSSALVELISKCNQAASLAASHFTLVTELQQLIGCNTVAIAVAGKRNQLRLAAMTGVSHVDQKSAFCRDLVDCATETQTRGSLTNWPPMSSNDQQATRIHQYVVQQHNVEAVTTIPLQTDDDSLGVVLLLGSRTVLHDANVQNIARAIAPPIASALAVRQQAEQGVISRPTAQAAVRIQLVHRSMALCSCSLARRCHLHDSHPVQNILRLYSRTFSQAILDGAVRWHPAAELC